MHVHLSHDYIDVCHFLYLFDNNWASFPFNLVGQKRGSGVLAGVV